MPVNPSLRVIAPIPADAEACPKCGGTTGWSGTLTMVDRVFGAWGSEAAEQDGRERDEYSVMRCDDCGEVFDYPPHNQGD
jgi:hypothetical protein